MPLLISAFNSSFILILLAFSSPLSGMSTDTDRFNVNEIANLAGEWKFLTSIAQTNNKKDGEVVYLIPGFTSNDRQRNILFTPVEDSHARSSNSGYELFHVNDALTTEILKDKPARLSISFVFEGKVMDIELERHNVFSENARFYHGNHDNKIPFDYIPGVYYRNSKKSDQTLVMAIGFFEGDIIGIMDDGHGLVDLGYMEDNNGKRTSIFAMRRAEDVFRNLPFNCEVKVPPNYIQDQDTDRYQPDVRSSSLCFDQYVEADYHLFQEKGSDVQQSINFVSGLYNQVMGLYSNEGITLVLSEVMVWTSPDPYNTNPFTTFSNAMSSGFNGDLAHLVSRNNNHSGGVAWLNTVCQSNSYYKTAFSRINSSYNNIPTYSWSVSVITHEVGHNLGSQHTHACVWNNNNTPIDCCGQNAGYGENSCTNNQNNNCNIPNPSNGGTIMSYCHLISGVGINFNHGFGTQPGNQIRSVLGTCSDCTAVECGLSITGTSSTPEGCSGDNDGTLSITATCTGCSSLEYSINHTQYQSSGIFTGLSSGIYTVTVRNTENTDCFKTVQVSVGTGTCICTQNLVTLTIRTDNYGSETSWIIVNSQNNVIASGPTGTVYPSNTTITENFCLPSECYEFRIFDSYGDGICCSYGSGFYRLEDAGGNILASGGQFGSSEFTPFCLTSGACTEEFIYVSNTPAYNPVSAISEITSDWVIDPNQNPQTIIFQAGENISLLPGFHARPGSSFQAYIEACSPSLPENHDSTQAVLPEEFPEIKSVSGKPHLSIIPNISNTVTTIEMTTYDDQEYQLLAFNQNGQLVRTLLNGVHLPAGIHQFSLRLDRLNAGMYYITMISRSGIQTERLVVIKY